MKRKESNQWGFLVSHFLGCDPGIFKHGFGYPPNSGSRIPSLDLGDRVGPAFWYHHDQGVLPS